MSSSWLIFGTAISTEATCMPPDNPKCKYHPTLEEFSEVHGVNTECAEQAFKWLGKFKLVTRKMTRHRYCFFIWKIIDEHNKRVKRLSRMQTVKQKLSWHTLTLLYEQNYALYLPLAILIWQCVTCLYIHACMPVIFKLHLCLSSNYLTSMSF